MLQAPFPRIQTSRIHTNSMEKCQQAECRKCCHCIGVTWVWTVDGFLEGKLKHILPRGSPEPFRFSFRNLSKGCYCSFYPLLLNMWKQIWPRMWPHPLFQLTAARETPKRSNVGTGKVTFFCNNDPARYLGNIPTSNYSPEHEIKVFQWRIRFQLVATWEVPDQRDICTLQGDLPTHSFAIMDGYVP